MFNIAKEYEELGLAPVPAEVRADNCEIKARWQNDFQSVENWAHYFKSQNGIGLKLGKASGSLQVIDVDQKHDATASLSARFLEAIKIMLPDVWDGFYIEETRSGGLHLFMQREGEAKSKFVPAKTIDTNKDGREGVFALIEVLGEGNMAFTHPTPNYRILQGSIEEIPTITDAHFDELISVCKSFNELPEQEIVAQDYDYPSDVDPNDMRPGSIFNKTVDPKKFAAFLVQHDWKVVKCMGEKYWFTRPGKDEGVSATFNHDGNRLFCVFTTSTEFEAENPPKEGEVNGTQKGYTPFSVVSKLMFNDDFKKCTAFLVERGFVNPGAWEDVDPLETVKAKPFDLESILPAGCEEFKQFVGEVAESYQVSPEMVLMPCISIISLALSGAVRLQVSEDWKEDAPIWTIVVSEASERKSPILKEVSGAIEKYLEDFKKKHRSALNAMKRKRRVLMASMEKSERKYEGLIGDGKDIEAEKLLTALTKNEERLESMPEVSDMPSLIQSDITVEALVQQLKKNGEVVGVISAEADPIEVALGLYTDKPNFSAYLKGFSVEKYTSNRVGGGETVIEQPRVVLSVLMQREPMEKLAESRVARKRGFLGRCFFAVPPSKVGDRDLEPQPVSEESRTWWAKKIAELMDMPHRLRFMDSADGPHFYEGDPLTVSMSPEAREALLSARHKNEAGLRTGAELDDDAGWGGKLMGNICRLALSLHFLKGGRVGDSISRETMETAIGWIPSLTEHYYCATGEVGEITMDKRVHGSIRRILDSDIDTSSVARVQDVYQVLKSKRFSKMKDWQPVFDRMIELGFVRIKNGEKPKGGATPKVMEFHPNFKGMAK